MCVFQMIAYAHQSLELTLTFRRIGMKALAEARFLAMDSGLNTTIYKSLEMDTKYVCRECGCEDIEIRAWVKANTDEVIEWVEDDNYGDCWCPNCDDITKYKLINN